MADDEVMARLLEAAGPALADESEYRSRIEARRRRRVVKQGRRAVAEHTVDYPSLDLDLPIPLDR